jgi:hypothetical protein
VLGGFFYLGYKKSRVSVIETYEQAGDFKEW